MNSINTNELKKHVEKTFLETTFDIVLTEGGKGPFDYFDESLLETRLNPTQNTLSLTPIDI
jgi:hypothetical protein